MTSPLHRTLRKLVGRRYRYLSDDWLLIDVLGDEETRTTRTPIPRS